MSIQNNIAKRLPVILLGFLCFQQVNISWGQSVSADTEYVRQPAKPNVIELYPGAYRTHFTFMRPDDMKNNYRLMANSSGYMGVYLSYKWLSLEYSWALPGTQLDKKIKLQNTSLAYRFYAGGMLFRPFYESFNGLLIPDQKRHHFSAFRDIAVIGAGTDIYWYSNKKHFSFGAANYFSSTQLKSAGGIIVMATPLWQRIGWNKPTHGLVKDSATYRLLTSYPQWISLVARLGYNYNFVLDHGKWSISPGILAGGGPIKQLRTDGDRFQPVTDLQAWINAGYSSTLYYVYLNASWDDCQTNLMIKNFQRTHLDVSLTGGYRFGNLEKKIAGIL